MNKFSFLLICLCISTASFSQLTVVVKSKSEKINAAAADGYSSELAGKKEDVASAWGKFLKDIGKAKNRFI